ncbi:hypothetical protein VA596_23450 [Amycolatopsis sp., V23-08]|uniref:Peptidoglycan binding-like domain-containing protein n=1 Tax=Amycolatopsis heterodermiae TaxID=3110235 RepID=A0ABU5R8E9_9PSEU|nr:hypothetical protein [Amycolatopsis sp., V23-08]MEA5362512.1 hypothetical protein [Amycolatopsis sp., V23-08]
MAELVDRAGGRRRGGTSEAESVRYFLIHKGYSPGGVAGSDTRAAFEYVADCLVGEGKME